MTVIPPLVRRPADVMHIIERFVPSADAERLATLVGGHEQLARVLETLAPRIVVRRPMYEALAAFEQGTSFRTSHHAGSGVDSGGRKVVERALGVYGYGVDGGKTVYGSVHMEASDVAVPLRTDSSFGDVAMMLKRDVFARTTFAPEDTGRGNVLPTALGGYEQLADVVAARGVPTGVDSGGVRQALAGVFVRANAGDMSHIEAQVRRAGPDDVERIFLGNSNQHPTNEADVKRLRELAAARGIPVEPPAR